MKRKEIFDIIKENNILHKLIEHLSQINKQTFSLCAEVKGDLRKLFHKFRKKLQECNKTYERFFATNESWLAMDVYLCDKPKNIKEPTSTKITGRPSSSFEDSSDRTEANTEHPRATQR